VVVVIMAAVVVCVVCVSAQCSHTHRLLQQSHGEILPMESKRGGESEWSGND
jgi:hypothetical protein